MNRLHLPYSNPPTLVSPMFMLELLHSTRTRRNKDKELWKSAHEKTLKIEAKIRTYFLSPSG